MTTALRPDRKERVPKIKLERPGKDFQVVGSTASLGFDNWQRAGRALWWPMLAMALMAFPIGLIISFFRADEIANEGNVATIASQQHLVPAFMFLGFASVFAAISFAIARILGTFRSGGGDVQEAANADQVQTLKKPWTAWVFLLGMMMAMMTILLGVALHFIAASLIQGDEVRAMTRSDQWFEWFEAIRRIGIVMYLTSIAFGLATIIQVLRFQSVRVRELAGEGGTPSPAATAQTSEPDTEETATEGGASE